MVHRLVNRSCIFGVMILMLLTPAMPLFSSTIPSQMQSDNEPMNGIHEASDFNESQGFQLSNVSIDIDTGEAVLQRPTIAWQGVTNGSLLFDRTGACSAYIESIDEILLMGGRIDPDPMQNGDETSTNSVERYYASNQTWVPSSSSMVTNQLYFGCTSIGDKVYAIGDYHPMEVPEVRSTGLVQIFNASNQTWTLEDSMPSGKGVGLAGVDNLGGFVYVAGGVSMKNRSDTTDRLMRYNPASNAWDEMASMNTPRHSFSLIAYHNQLYAIGGQSTLYNSTSNSIETTTLNRTEVYNPNTDSWTNQSNLSFQIAAYAATVHNDEILISGGITGSGFGMVTSDVHGYNPIDGTMKTHSSLSTDVFDHTLTSSKDSVLYAAGDSSFYRFSTWSNNYQDLSDYFINPSDQQGWVSSETIDLRKSIHGSASPVWIMLEGTEETGSSLELQYKLAADLLAMSTANWMPTGIQNSSDFLSIGNHSLTLVGSEQSFIQYRIRLSTSELNQWNTPDADGVKLYSEEASILSQVPVAMHPNAEPITISTFHSSYSSESSYTMEVSSTNFEGFAIPGSQPAVLIWDPLLESWNLTDPNGILRTDDIDVLLQSSTLEGDYLTWSLAIDEGISSDFLTIKISTDGIHTTEYEFPTVIEIDNVLDVKILEYSADFSSDGGEGLNSLEVIPGGTTIEVLVDHRFNTTGTTLLYGAIEARIHLDIEHPNGGSSNESGVWFLLESGQETIANFTVSNTASGTAKLSIEARTQDNFALNVLPTEKFVIVNVDEPIQVSTNPQSGSYLNKNPQRDVEFLFFDVGGFSSETVSAHVWIEALHDSNEDMQASENEFIPYELSISNIENQWRLNMTVNDTANQDHQMVHVRLDGTDLAGKQIRSVSSNYGRTSWESRTSETSTLVSINPLYETFFETTQRIEPTGMFGWEVRVTDTNSLSDISEVRLELGGDESLGIKYNVNLNTCSAIDGRILVQPLCQSNSVNQILTISFIGQADWSFSNAALELGLVEVFIQDYDGLVKFNKSNLWSLERQMSVQLHHLSDTQGEVQGELEAGWTMISQETVVLNATIKHLLSNSSYDGVLSIFWRGKVQNERFSDGLNVEVADGTLQAELSAPSGSGLWHETTLEIWDPYNSVNLFSIDLPNMYLDGTPPLLVTSALTSGISRYHLDSVEIGVSIEENIGWSSNLTLHCQIKSLDFEWPIITLNRGYSTVFDGKTLFSFVFDFSHQGDPSTLSSQANIGCWAEGSDDAGWPLSSSQGNSQSNPWLTSILNNIGPDISIENIDFEGSFEPGSTLRMSIRVKSSGEQIEQPFNVTISVQKDDVQSVVGRKSVPEIAANSALNVRISLTVPTGEWTLVAAVDEEGELWELDEVNNIWSENYSSSDEGFSSTTVVIAVSGAGIAALIVVGLLLKKRDPKSSLTVSKPPLKGPPPKKSNKSKPAGLKGPPPKKENQGEREVVNTQNHDIGVTVSDYSKLPGGGEYEYIDTTTYYVGKGIGHWVQNGDQSFTRIDPESMA